MIRGLVVGVALGITMMMFMPLRAQQDANAKVAQEIQELLQRNLAAYDAEDIKATLATLHPQSEFFRVAEAQHIQQFKDSDIKPKLTGFRFLATDPDFAYARVSREYRREPTDTKSTEFDQQTLEVFRKDGDQWKSWAGVSLVRSERTPAAK